jgi:integrase/recombinase XerC
MTATVPSTGVPLAVVCDRARGELAGLGDLGGPLVAVLGVVERVGAGRGVEVLTDPGFAVEVLVSSPGVDAGLVGRVLDFLRSRHGLDTVTTCAAGGGGGSGRVSVRLADAIAGYEAGPLALMATGTGHTYRTWTRRLAAVHGDDAPGSVTAGDLKDLIARHVLAARREGERRRSGRSAEENAVAAYRSLWAYLVEKGWAGSNVALALTKPSRVEPNRRPLRPDEIVLLRHLAVGTGRDPLLDEVTLTLAERLGLRRIELCRLRFCDLDLPGREVEVWGKGDKARTLPLPPALADLLARYVEDRRPRHLAVGEWLACEETLLRRGPTVKFPLGRAAGRRRIEDLYTRLRGAAPQVFAKGDVSLHSYRHALGTFIDLDDRFGRAVTRAVLGHTSRRSPTDHYIHVPPELKAEAVTAYEQRVLAVEPAGRLAIDGDNDDIEPHEDPA